MSPEIIDVARIAHLLCFALGMGAALYFDLRTLGRVNVPLAVTDITEAEQVHRFVFAALAGMWVTGVALIYIRTGFVLSEFSPKLWTKVATVTALSLNAVVIGWLVMPVLQRAVGERMIALPLGRLVPLCLASSVSLFLWLGSLSLGASAILKVADWPVLGMFMGALFLLCVLGTLAMVLCCRWVCQRRSAMALVAGGQSLPEP